MRSGQQRSSDRIEALLCFVLSYLTSGWLAVFWVVLGLVTIFGWWDWAAARVVRWWSQRVERRP